MGVEMKCLGNFFFYLNEFEFNNENICLKK